METKRLVNAGAEALLGVTVPVLDKGYIKLVDYMGIDETVVAAARHSYDKGLDLNDEDGNRKLIDFLMRERHTSPFEQPAMVFEVKAPIFVFREWHRHRTAKLNEMSGRYTELMEEFYVPATDRVQAQSKSNKQGSGAPLPKELAGAFQARTIMKSQECFRGYRANLRDNVAKELARIALPVNTYSKMVWQCDLHNLLHFLKLRMAPQAQWEIRQYANLIGQQVEAAFPKVWAAFDEYVLNAVTFSKTEVAQLREIIDEFYGLSGTGVSREDFNKLATKLGSGHLYKNT